MITSLKYILSFLFPISIETSLSEISGEIKLKFYKGEYQLVTQNAIYSWGKKYYNYAIAFDEIRIKNKSIESYLSLGYGLGSTTKILQSYFPNIQTLGIETDPKVIQWNKEYIDLENVELIQSDAIDFVKNHSNKYDLITLDLFIDDIVPSKSENEQFFKDLKSLLSKDGIILYNRLAHLPLLKERTNKVKNICESVFDSVSTIHIKGNEMLILK